MKNNAGFIVGVIIFLFAATMFWQSFSFNYSSSIGPGPGLFPRWLSGLLMIFSLLFIWECLRSNKIELTKIIPKGKPFLRVITIIGSILLFIVISPYSGFNIAASIIVFLLLIPECRWYKSLCISVVVSVIIFTVFKTLLNVPLPTNSFGW